MRIHHFVMLPAMLRSAIDFDADASFSFVQDSETVQLPTIDQLFASLPPSTAQSHDVPSSVDECTLQLPTNDDLFFSIPHDTTPTLGAPSCIHKHDGTAIPYISQKNKTSLLFEKRFFTKWYSTKSVTTWKCTAKTCVAKLRTPLDNYSAELIVQHGEQCQTLTEIDIQRKISASSIVNDTSQSTSKDLAQRFNHPYSRKQFCVCPMINHGLHGLHSQLSRDVCSLLRMLL